MENNEEKYYTCLKCGSNLLKYNQFLHDLRCTGPINNNINNNSINDNINDNSINDNINNNITNNNINNNITNNNINNNSTNNTKINSNSVITNPIINNINNYDNLLLFDNYICEICGAQMLVKEKHDHLLCHQLEKNEKNVDNNLNLNDNDLSNEDKSYDSDSENIRNNNFFVDININNNRDNYRINNRNNNRSNIFNDSDDGLDNSLDEELSDDLDGLDDFIIQTYPTSKIKEINHLDEDKKKCLICLENFKIGDDSIILPCIHIFHSECIKKWMKNKNACPICKNKIHPND